MTVQSIVIRPAKADVDNVAEFKELWKFRHLLLVLVKRGIRITYKNSVLGIAWSMITPLFTVLVLTVVVGYIMNVGSKNLSAYIFCAMLPWNFFQNGVLDSSMIILAQLGLIKKIYIPRELLILSSVLQSLVQFFISVFVFILYRWGLTTLIVGFPGLPPLTILYFPVAVAIMFFCTTGIALFLGATNVFYEDTKFITKMIFSLGFYLMPIIYPAEKIEYMTRVSPRLASLAYHIYLLNPITWVVESFRQIFFGRYNMAGPGLPVQMTAPFDPRYMAIDGIESIIICYLGYSFFNRYKWKFTERP